MLGDAMSGFGLSCVQFRALDGQAGKAGLAFLVGADESAP
jgi:hypothetical protein